MKPLLENEKEILQKSTDGQPLNEEEEVIIWELFARSCWNCGALYDCNCPEEYKPTEEQIIEWRNESGS